MKLARLLLTLILVALMLPLTVLASNVSNATYQGIITITNSTGSTITDGYVSYTLNTASFIAAGYMNSTANNTATLSPPATDVAYQFSANGDNNSWVYVPSIPATSTITDHLYTGGTTNMSGKLSYFPGSTGMTAADNATLELGDNFTIEQRGFVDLSTTGANFTAKNAAINVYTSGTSNITAAITGGATVTADGLSEGEHILTIQAKPESLGGYGHRKQITVEGTTAGAQTNYQMLLNAVQDDDWYQFASGWDVDDTFYSDPTPGVDYEWAPDVLKIGGTYFLYYSATTVGWGAWDIYLSTSNTTPDGTYTPYLGTPVVSKGAAGKWNDSWVHNPSLITVGGTHYMFFEGNDGAITRIGYATSVDGYTWTVQTIDTPILSEGAGGAWDDVGVGVPRIIQNGATFYLFFDGWDGTTSGGLATNMRLGYATASSITGPYTKLPGNPVLSTGATGTWDDAWVGGMDIFYYAPSAEWIMFYEAEWSGLTLWSSIGLAKSTDLTTWTKYPDPIFSESKTFPTFGAMGIGLYTEADEVYVYWTPVISNYLACAKTVAGIDYTNRIMTPSSQNDFDDLRFTTNDGTTELNYWIESKVDGSYAKLWLEMDSIPASPDSSIFYAYYGNASAAAASSGDATFDFFDDFNDGVIDGAKWFQRINNGSESEAGGIFSVTGGAAAFNAWGGITETGDNHTYRGRITVNSDTMAAGTFVEVFGIDERSSDGTFAGSLDYAHFTTYDPLGRVIMQQNNAGVSSNNSNPYGLSSAYHVTEIRRNSTDNVVYDIDGFWWNTLAAGSPTATGGIACYTNQATRTVSWDWVLIRNWVLTEPTWGTWGADENLTTHPGGLAIYFDGILADNTTLGGVAVPDNANGWVFVEQNAMPYMYYHKVWVGGNLVQEINFEIDTTFTDLSGNSQDTTPSFRTAGTPGLTATLTSFGPISSPVAPPTTTPAGWVTTANISGNFTTSMNPFGCVASIIQDAAAAGSTPSQLPFIVISTVILLIVSLGTSFLLRSMSANGSLFAKGLFCLTIMGMFVATRWWDLWMLGFFVIFFAAFGMMSRHQSWQN